MKSTLYIASSINGFMTRGESDSGWVSDKDEAIFAETCQKVGCLLVGRKTFDQYQGVVYPVPNAVHVVLSSQERTSDNPNVHFVKNLDEALAKFAELGFDRFVAVGGAHVIGMCMEAQLIDEIYLSIHPYVFGEGLPIFKGYTGEAELSFDGIEQQHKELILLKYTVTNHKAE